MELPTVISDSKLWQRLGENTDLQRAVAQLRSTAEILASTISSSVPNFTDHSVRHMDALWTVADRVLTEDEIGSLSVGEAFLLGIAFYLHDIGMAFAASPEGLARVRESQQYRIFVARVRFAANDREWEELASKAEAQAVAHAVRKLHADAASILATAPIPGTSQFLLEPNIVREIWATTAGKMSSSHHWNLDQIERELGRQGTVPLGNVGKGDLAYVACILRLVDYAHINRDRASTLERALRQPLEPDSLLHWLAQEKIDGPERDGSELVYRSSSPIQDVDAWWLYFGMLSGLDREISAVRRYLDHRPPSQGRLSLERVRGASSPQEAAIFIQTSGFAPIEVNIRAGSIDRLVKLLGGETLYGAEPMAAVRELIQNARDAVMLKGAVAENDFERASFALPIIVKLDTKEPASLEVTDYGVGMSRRVMTDYLVSIASDYWTSEQFFTDFPSALDRGFKPAGKFGIGFVSVFMLGDQVQVESNRDGGERLRLTLRGVGRQGELRALAAPAGSGTSVKIRVNQEAVGRLKEFPELCKAFAPMLLHDLRVEVDGIATEIKQIWWRR